MVDSEHIFQQGKSLQPQIGNLGYEVKRLQQEILALSLARPCGGDPYLVQQQEHQRQRQLAQARQRLGQIQGQLGDLEARLKSLANDLFQRGQQQVANAGNFRNQARYAPLQEGRQGLEEAAGIAQAEAQKHESWAAELLQSAQRAASAASCANVSGGAAGSVQQGATLEEVIVQECQAAMPQGGQYSVTAYAAYPSALPQGSTSAFSSYQPGNYSLGNQTQDNGYSSYMPWSESWSGGR